ncbi:TetR/AcrR family transcriptional regulator [Cryptosporangium aurantiacum]|uniref:Transcriptional regulator, TetR family n=1 Tax=Cryptosporangium aurantiacum TaxID=134849 RepID=A0A1M7Q3S8_9ACTN|nr:TetR/AcrR family transcriptional regulator [Cryptosporangium aurantiacum]SHN24855.1 transcriptional regulator, TetR family [Cryptosporangium aurantiacum]
MAEDAFRDEDVVSLDEIARRAGLGRATVYRHFPDRYALGIAVATQWLTELEHRAATNGSDGWTFRDLLYAVLTLQTEQRSLVHLFRELPERAQRRYTDALLTILGPAFRRAQEDGSLRDDIAITDLPLVFEMLEGALRGGPSAVNRGEATERLLGVLLDGLFGTRAALRYPA